MHNTKSLFRELFSFISSPIKFPYPRFSLTKRHSACTYYFIPKRFSYNAAPLGWKTKWRYDDFRHERDPYICITLFGISLNITFSAKGDHYVSSAYEAWLYWTYISNRYTCKYRRCVSMFRGYNCTWTNFSAGKTEDHYEQFLKKKYLKLYRKWKEKHTT